MARKRRALKRVAFDASSSAAVDTLVRRDWRVLFDRMPRLARARRLTRVLAD